MHAQALPIVMAGLLAAAAVFQDDAVQKDLQKLQGTWVLESRRISNDPDDKETKRAKGLEWKVVIDGDKWIDQIRGKPTAPMKIKIDPSANPRPIELSMTLKSGRTEIRKGLYDVDGDTLTVALGSLRLVPKGLKEPEPGCNLMVLKRAKK